MSDWAPLVDVGDMTLAELVEVVDGPIYEATLRLIDELADPDGVCCGFGSNVE